MLRPYNKPVAHRLNGVDYSKKFLAAGERERWVLQLSGCIVVNHETHPYRYKKGV
jgi:hypothetical protein